MLPRRLAFRLSTASAPPHATATAPRHRETRERANNPPLRNGDVVVVDRNTFTKVTDTMTDAMLPFEPVVNAVSVYRLLGLPAPTSGGR